MQTSEQINELATALAKAQGEFEGAKKDSDNPFFKSKYSDLASYIQAAKPMHKYGLSVSQMPESTEAGDFLVTTLMHSSGQWMRASMRLQPKGDGEQPRGSSLTYVRRYAFGGVTGLPAIDDDANTSDGKKPAYAEAHTPVSPEVRNVTEDRAREVATIMRGVLELDLVDDVKSLKVLDKLDELNKNHEEYQAAWGQMSAPERKTWKILVEHGKKIQQRPMMANGRA